ncbi:hypothetical protein AB1L30_25945 [Bremerella sp. JC817]|uniref:hypothetical protein n=1 Tax=Bremerella sp. JC817 TaxID=3231756 RepID=UPI0034588FD4
MLKVYAGALLLVIVLIVCSLGRFNPASRVIDSRWVAKENSSVDSDTAVIFTALQQKDFGIVRSMLPLEVTSAESDRNYYDRYQDILNDLESDSVRIQQMVVASNAEFYQSRQHDWVVVPTEAVVAYADGQVLQRGFLLGVRAKDETAWSYLDFTINWQHSRQFIELLFPEIPKNIPLPECTATYHDP